MVGAPPKKSDWQVRTVTTLLLLSVLVAVVFLRQPAVYVAAFFIVANAFREVVRVLNYTPANAPFFDICPPTLSKGAGRFSGNVLPWAFFFVTSAVATIYTLHDVIIRSFPGSTFVPAVLHYAPMTFYLVWCVLFMLFVCSLDPSSFRPQLLGIGWSWLIMGWFIMFGSFFLRSANNGMLWLLLPFLSINANDIFAYICGRACGRTPIIPKLSPKKTVEGFVGALFCTVAVAMAVCHYTASFESMKCRFVGFGVPLECPNPAVNGVYERTLVAQTPFGTVVYAPIVLHAIPVALFASLVAPFGGFFASAVKRTLDIKDFGTMIPGHGGMTDRMDCQLLMGLFASVYYSTFVA